MLKRSSILALGLSAFLVFAACGSGDDTGSSGSGSSGGRQFLSVGTAPAGGTFFVIGSAIAEVLDGNAGDRGWSVTAEATKGSQENIRRIDAGELELALANSAISYFAARGSERWGDAADIRAVMTLAPNVALFIAPEGGVKSVAELKGKRVYLGPSGAGFDYFIRPILEAHGLTWEDLVPIHGGQSQAVDYLADGSADAAFLGGGIPVASITQAATSQDIVFIPYEEEAIEQLTGEYLFFRRATIPAGTYKGLDTNYSGLDVGSMHLITSASADEELVYQLTKTLYENRDQVVAKHAAGKAINPKNAARDTGTLFHPGARRYYQEIGIWADESPEGDEAN
ncbi:MAG: TAXI family TRAP transporter solute-binding subunit [Acidobacteria bacterium]|nr:TAXI family TRAP transporter solute-binding subunit [Acidobacteriota bacterium]NIM61347.1 TAXI family TRAP transporter solute-binding subunit [Acidobacteriota bacterium]NIO58793.1 TAXI family TRAP transporter solute-binding subunit [Acidobacteriota bacterium]NIQ29836.1 TAXI family TRAP transporter solute-binding subunit [Acidobacteriota bacterium]NIQ84561.1 TAXI family TRAP transporter solute-binding subunit [Acidobacteriota bacterium]